MKASPEKLAYIRKWQLANKERRRAAVQRYNKSAKGIATKLKYSGTEKQRACFQRARSKIKTILASRLRHRVRNILKRGKGVRPGSAVRDLGCSMDAFKQYIAEKFVDGMSWDNYGSWHLDHICPLRLFDLSVREQFLQACHYSNYQPLWAVDNRRKAGKWLEAA
jgi:hypothetical protein